MNKVGLCGYLLIIIALLMSTVSCNTSTVPAKDSSNSVSVKDFGAKGDGKTDDTQAIQTAFDSLPSVYFPPGRYRIGQFTSRQHNPAALRITEVQKVREIKFATGAELYLPAQLDKESVSMVLLKVFADKGDIDKVVLDGLRINAELRQDGDMRKVAGIKAIEHQGNKIKNLVITNGEISNMTSVAINTYATNTTITNFKSTNNQGGGIGAKNPYNLGELHTLSIDNFTSVNDGGFGINFSGREIANRKKADPQDFWRGKATNIRVVNSERGIKTAGYWDLELENVFIDGSDHYGFFVNKDAPDRTININDLEIRNTKDAGISLSNQTNVNMRNVRILNCQKGLLTFWCPVTIDSLEIVGKPGSNFGLRVANHATISNFSISGFSEEYVAWVLGGDVKLTNGHFFNNECIYPLLIHEKAGEVILDNITFAKGKGKLRRGDILSIQQQDNLVRRRMSAASFFRKQ